MKLYKILFFLLFFLSCQHKTPTEPNGETGEPQWAMYGGNVRHTGNVNTPAYDGIVGPTDSNTIQIKWSIVTNDFVGPQGGGVEAPLVADANGTIYATTLLDLIAINSDGTLKWHFEEGGNSSVAIGTDGTVYYHGNTGYLYALALDGSVLWKTRTFNVPDAHPLFQTSWMNIILIGNSTIALNSRDSLSFSILALDTRDGSVVWRQFEVLGAINGAGSDGTIYLSEPNQFHALNASGSLKWSVPTEYGIGGNFHVAVDGVGNIYKWPEIITSNGVIIRQDLLGISVALWHDRYYVTTGLRDTLFCHSLTSDELFWHDQPDVQFLSNPTVDQQGNVYVIGSALRGLAPIPGVVFGYSKSGEKNIEFPIEFVRKPFAPLLLPDGSVIITGYQDRSITCVK